jgi:acyl carrier protein phosphodiesterase
MNYLAHLSLSGNNKELLLGNFIADHVKGSQLSHLSPAIVAGVRLHRMIDTFTDSHPVTAIGKERLRKHVSKYAPVALDIIYDHYLAVNWLLYHKESLPDFLERSYKVLDENIALMPEKTQHMYSYMRRDNWLGNYIHPEGIRRALNGLSRRTRFESNLEKAFEGMMTDYHLFDKEFALFFPTLQQHVAQKMTAIG